MYCINPSCSDPANPGSSANCIHCDTSLLVRERYSLIRPLVEITPTTLSQIFEIEDRVDRTFPKVMKVLVQPFPEFINLIRREDMALGVLSTPGRIPRVALDAYFTVKTANHLTLHCLVMERIAGQNLSQWLEAGGTLSETQAIDWLRQLTELLKIVHDGRFFHRDIKPENIILRPDRQLALIDFGAIREVTDSYLLRLKVTNSSSTIPNLTSITAIVSPGYTPLEQANGQAVFQSDFFALGRTFVYLLTRELPVRLLSNSGTDRLQWRNRAPQISPPFADFLDHLMSPDWHDRPSTPEEILRLLDALPQKIKRDRFLRSWQFKAALGVVGILLLTVMAVGANFWLSQSRLREAQRLLQEGREDQLSDRPAAAKEKFERSLQLNPNAPAAYNNLARLCQTPGVSQPSPDYDCAIRNYQKALQLAPNNPQVMYNLAGLYSDTGNYIKAKKYYEKVIGLRQNTTQTVDAKNNLARIENIQGNYKEAMRLVAEALPQATDSDSQSSLHKNLGWAKFKLGDYGSAVTNLEQANQLEERTDVYCLLAQVRQAQGRPQVARELLQKCLQRNDRTTSLPEVQIWKAELIKQFLQ